MLSSDKRLHIVNIKYLSPDKRSTRNPIALLGNALTDSETLENDDKNAIGGQFIFIVI